MASFVTLARHQIRRLYSIEGSGMEDFWASLILYPQTLAQMMAQVPNPPVKYEKKALRVPRDERTLYNRYNLKQRKSQGPRA